MNFALKAEVARTFLDSAGIPYLSAHSDKQLSAADVGDIGRPLTVLIECSDQTRESGPAKEPAQAAVPPQETTQFNYRVTQNLFLRSEPDKSSLNMLTNYAPDYIPEETIFTWKNRPGASICTVGRGGEIWCQITYTHDGGIQTVGWVSAHFLRSTITNTLLACLFQNSDPDCAPPPSSLYLKCTPTVIASEPDPITSISVGLIRQGSQISSFDAWHHSAKGNIYKRSEQYVDRHFQIPNVQEPHWLWEGRWNKDLNVYMIGQLAALARVLYIQGVDISWRPRAQSRGSHEQYLHRSSTDGRLGATRSALGPIHDARPSSTDGGDVFHCWRCGLLNRPGGAICPYRAWTPTSAICRAMAGSMSGDYRFAGAGGCSLVPSDVRRTNGMGACLLLD